MKRNADRDKKYISGSERFQSVFFILWNYRTEKDRDLVISTKKTRGMCASLIKNCDFYSLNSLLFFRNEPMIQIE